MLDAIEQNPARPTVICRCMFIVSASMYDAWTAYEDTAMPYTLDEDVFRRPLSQRTDANRDRAVSYAAYRALIECFPDQQPEFAALMSDLGYPLSNSTDITTPEGIGNVAANETIARRSNDGSNWQNNYADTTSSTFPTLYQRRNKPNPESRRAPGGDLFDPNHWQPLRVANGTLVDGDGVPIFDNDDDSTYFNQEFLTPHWGAVTPFALRLGNQFRPPAPPMKGSSQPYVDSLGNRMTNDQAWNTQFDAVLNFSENLTDTRKVIAEFWADGPRSWTPPGHWNQFAQGLAIRDNMTTGQCVKMFFALNGGMLDASIAVWECKRFYDYIRPASAIRHKYFDQIIMAWGGPDQGTQPILGQNWRPYQALTFVTPPFAEYVSGHSAFSRNGREVLRAFTGSDTFYDGVTRIQADFDNDGEEDYLGEHVVLPGGNMFEGSPSTTITLRWTRMLDASREAGLSRVYGGIHIQDGDIYGRKIGREVGQRAFRKAHAYWSPIRGDFERDGVLDYFDIEAFLRLARANDPDADVNGDGRIDFQDFILMCILCGG
ncbi:MAG: DUF6851 domain-containing protein [Phycisphaerales bacterium]